MFKIDDIIEELKINENNLVDYQSLKNFVLSFSVEINSVEAIKSTNEISKLPDFRNFLAEAQNSNIQKQPFRIRTFLEIYLKKFLVKKTQTYDENNLKEFEFWVSVFLENYRILQENQTLKTKYEVNCLVFHSKYFYFFHYFLIFFNKF